MDTPTKAARKLLPHPLSMMFPKMDADAFNAMLESFRQVGWDSNHPIVTYRGMILDGRNRMFAVEEFNKTATTPITPTFREFTGTDDEAADFAMRENFARRHMTQSQRAGIGLKMKQYFESRKPGPVAPGAKPSKSTPTQRAAKFVNASPAMISNASKLQKLSPKLLDAVIEGTERSLGSAIKKAEKAACVVRTEPPPPAVDSIGLPMHPRAKDAITTGRAEYTKLIRTLQQAKRDAIALAAGPHGRAMQANALEVDFKNLIRLLRYSAPFTSCPLDDPCDDKCRVCMGTQWITEGAYNSLPPGAKPVAPKVSEQAEEVAA
jgi:hypothetical protein